MTDRSMTFTVVMDIDFLGIQPKDANQVSVGVKLQVVIYQTHSWDVDHRRLEIASIGKGRSRRS